MNTKLVLYRPPGKVVAWRMILSILKDSVDSAGNRVERLGDLVDHAAAHAPLQALQVFDLGDGPLGVKDDAGAMREEGQHLDPLVLSGELRVFGGDAAVRDGKGLRGVAQERHLGHLGVDKAARRVAMHGEGDVGQTVFDGIVGPWRSGDTAGQEVALHLAGGVFLQQVTPFFLGHAGGMRRGQPARNGEYRVGTGHSGGHGSGSGEKGKGK